MFCRNVERRVCRAQVPAKVARACGQVARAPLPEPMEAHKRLLRIPSAPPPGVPRYMTGRSENVPGCFAQRCITWPHRVGEATRQVGLRQASQHGLDRQPGRLQPARCSSGAGQTWSPAGGVRLRLRRRSIWWRPAGQVWLFFRPAAPAIAYALDLHVHADREPGDHVFSGYRRCPWPR